MKRISRILWKCDNFSSAAENLESELNNILMLAAGSDRVRKENAFNAKLGDFECTIAFLVGKNII